MNSAFRLIGIMRSLVLGLALIVSVSAPAFAKTKYGSKAVPLSRDQTYLKKSEAPDFWAMSPFYIAQRTGSSCSTASIATAVNGLRDSYALTSDDTLVTEESVLERSKSKAWRKSVSKGGRGVSLGDLRGYVEATLIGYGLKDYIVEAKIMENASPESVAAFRKVLKENEASKNNAIVINFLQSVLTEDADVGHVSPLGAFDEKTDRVLVMDVDREWYEPYWVSVEDVVKSMATRDSSKSKNRGYLWIHQH